MVILNILINLMYIMMKKILYQLLSLHQMIYIIKLKIY